MLCEEVNTAFGCSGSAPDRNCAARVLKQGFGIFLVYSTFAIAPTQALDPIGGQLALYSDSAVALSFFAVATQASRCGRRLADVLCLFKSRSNTFWHVRGANACRRR